MDLLSSYAVPETDLEVQLCKKGQPVVLGKGGFGQVSGAPSACPDICPQRSGRDCLT